MQILSLKSFVVLDEDDKGNFDRATNLALMLDQVDFCIDDYPVNNKRYPLIEKALLRGKEKVALVDNNEEDVEDIGGVGGIPSLSITNLDSNDSLDDVVSLGQGSVSHSMSDDFARPNRNLDILDFDHLNISERPSSAPVGPGGSSTKRRRVVGTDGWSPLDRPGLDYDPLHHLEEKIKE